MDFNYFLPTKIISGRNCLVNNGKVFDSFGKRALIVTGGSSAAKSGALIDCISVLENSGIQYITFSEIEPNPTTVSCLKAGKIARSFEADFVIGIGGGSVLDSAKAIALFACCETDDHLSLYSRKIPSPHLPVVLIGTTAGTGSEVTGVSVLTNPETGRKKSISGADCYADVSFCDYGYTCSVPENVTVSTALDAFCHAVEAYLASSCNQMTALFSEKAIRLLSKYILSECKLELNDELRNILYTASIYAGLAINNAGTDFPHTVGYYLTENYGVSHGNACAVFMPVLLERAEKYCPEKLEAVLDFMKTDTVTLGKAVKRASSVDIKISLDEAEKAAARWSAGVKNFDRSPGGFTCEDAVAALTSI